ncbi:MAG: fatty acid desaturase [Planctomycetales bacterium]|nr:fatty acid desaturase [Planctomycetales bacterium]
MSEADAPSPADFSMSEARHLIGDLLRPKPWIYWTDLVLSLGCGTACWMMVREFAATYGVLSWQVILTFLVNCLLYYRVATFTHELTHLPKDGFQGFRLAWNLFCGIPFLMPSFTYHTHADHHRRKHYGTKLDGEYLPLGNRHPICIVGYVAECLILGPAGVVRWLILTPLTWLHPWLRDRIHERFSSLVINPLYVRPLPSNRQRWIIRIQELGCFLWCLNFVLIALFFGPALKERGLAQSYDAWWLAPPMPFVLQAYATSVVVLLLNSLRTVASHRWYNEWNKANPEMTFTEQLLDSVNFPYRPWFTGLWGPIGMRYHALHHLFPSLPYHSMGAAHRRLMEGLPADSPYRRTNEVSMFAALRDLWKRASASARATPADQAQALAR